MTRRSLARAVSGKAAGRRGTWRLGGKKPCPRRRPVTVLAKQLTGLDVLIGGRLDVALPAGEDAAEVALVLRTLARGEQLFHEGTLSRAEGARCLPPSPQAGGFPLFSITERGQDWLTVEPLP